MPVFIFLMKKYIDKFIEYLKNHWIIGTLVTAGPSIFFLLLQVVGKQLKLIDGGGNLYIIPLIIFIICIILDVLITGYKYYNDNIYINKYKDDQILLNNILSSLDTIDDSICNELEKFIKDGKRKSHFKEPFYFITRPEQEIKIIIRELIVCLSKLTNLNREEIGVSIIYKYDFENGWQTPISENVSGRPIKDIIENPNSTARKLINENKDFICCPNKDKAFQGGYYVVSAKDDDKRSGSIICARATISNGENVYVQGILSITTYGKQLLEENDEDTEECLKSRILTPFMKIIQKELGCAYINRVRYLQMEKKNIKKDKSNKKAANQ